MLKHFGRLIHDPCLWHLNRRSAAGGLGIGLFFAFWPVPFQMWLSAAASVPLRVNLPLSIASVWVTNPLTMPPVFYFAYLLGSMILGTEMTQFEFELSWEWVLASSQTIGPAFLLGCSILSVLAGLIGYFGLDWFWRYSVARAWRNRPANRVSKVKATSTKSSDS